ncbi:hypothetical protein RHA1_ro11080 (plasmid) [Rhodococcus jostii RHA1]|uniref:Uncharacterized protein n=1 Tax=Rhodococcus jostii (strain RHA1) TaxID=101510 RepID=Q0RVF9_RHOJR|nr:hypothetical protein RHA1_ro11080 [Rhodococcus jostii RHA1]
MPCGGGTGKIAAAMGDLPDRPGGLMCRRRDVAPLAVASRCLALASIRAVSTFTHQLGPPGKSSRWPHFGKEGRCGLRSPSPTDQLPSSMMQTTATPWRGVSSGGAVEPIVGRCGDTIPMTIAATTRAVTRPIQRLVVEPSGVAPLPWVCPRNSVMRSPPARFDGRNCPSTRSDMSDRQ